eukprot:scaffold90960_cov25-Tisochrysis_lutea.AAC.2
MPHPRLAQATPEIPQPQPEILVPQGGSTVLDRRTVRSPDRAVSGIWSSRIALAVSRHLAVTRDRAGPAAIELGGCFDCWPPKLNEREPGRRRRQLSALARKRGDVLCPVTTRMLASLVAGAPIPGVAEVVHLRLSLLVLRHQAERTGIARGGVKSLSRSSQILCEGRRDEQD